MKTFIVHYKKLLERKLFMLNQLDINSINAEFVDWYDRDTLKKAEAASFNLKWPFWFLISKRERASICITLSHIYCWTEVVRHKYEYALVLEDDAILSDNFRAILERYITHLPSDWDMLFIGDACNFHIPDIKAGVHIYKKSLQPTPWGGMGGTRAADSYLVSYKCAQKILDFIKSGKKIDQQVDWWLNGVMRDCSLNVYWAEPTIVSQGSQCAKYKTSWR
jgi:GR25 family glycosyltransferase involved in LPS biosynthesis